MNPFGHNGQSLEESYLKLHDGEKLVERNGVQWVACAHCGVLKRNSGGHATWRHAQDCPERERP